MSDLNQLCSIDGCESTVKATDWCDTHYMRWRRHGDPLAYWPNKIPLMERFEEKVELIPFSTCHFWTGALDRSGYGQIYKDGKTEYAHRIAYELYIGPIANDLQVLHKCDNPICVRIEHLFLGTHQDNMDDKMKKGRHRGAGSG